METNQVTAERRIKVGDVLKARSVCDHDCVFTATVLKRTTSTVTVKVNGYVEPKTTKIRTVDGVEGAYCLGRYSMAPFFKN